MSHASQFGACPPHLSRYVLLPLTKLRIWYSPPNPPNSFLSPGMELPELRTPTSSSVTLALTHLAMVHPPVWFFSTWEDLKSCKSYSIPQPPPQPPLLLQWPTFAMHV